MNGDDLFSLLEGITTPEQVAHACLAICGTLGFECYFFSLYVPQSPKGPTEIAISSLPQDWQRHYRAAGYEKVDPIIERSSRSVAPFFWDEIERDTRIKRTFFSDARRFGVEFGVTFPLSGPLNATGSLNFARRDPLAPERQARRALVGKAMLLAAQLHAAVRALVLGPDGVTVPRDGLLTRRERECLALSASGCTTSEIAESLGIAPRTVAFHIDRSVAKLGVHSRRAALTRALLLGEISVQSLWRAPDRGQKQASSPQA